MAVNQGYDADTTAAIVGQLAGAHYGYDTIPSEWIEQLDMYSIIDEMTNTIYNRVDKRLIT